MTEQARRRGVGRPPGDGWDWQQSESAADLMALASSPVGAQEPSFLAGYPSLLRLDLMQSALRQADGDHLAAMHIAHRFLENQATPEHLSADEIAAFAVAIGLEASAPPGKRRLDAAAQLGLTSTTAYTRARRSANAPHKTSVESDLMIRVSRCLEGDPRTIRSSHTHATPRTPWPINPPTHEEIHALCGTWRGITATKNMVKALSNKSGPHETYMVVEPDGAGVAVHWLFQDERDVPAVAVTLIKMPRGIRMTCVYEVEVKYLPREDRYPHHRGTCLLDIADLNSGPWSGRYFTDAGTSGVLDFTAHVSQPAEDLLEARYLFRHTPVDSARIAAMQAAVERGLSDAELSDLLPWVAAQS